MAGPAGRLYRALIICMLIPAALQLAEAQTITAVGEWNLNITSANLQAGAGSDVSDTYESDPDEVELNVREVGGRYTVDVRLDDTGDWNTDLILSAQRTNLGCGCNTVDANVYQVIGDIDVTIVNAAQCCLDWDFQFKLEGVSVLLGAGTYSTTLLYTVTD